MTLNPAGASSYCPVDHEVAAEYNGCGDEDRCDAQEKDAVSYTHLTLPTSDLV